VALPRAPSVHDRPSARPARALLALPPVAMTVLPSAASTTRYAAIGVAASVLTAYAARESVSGCPYVALLLRTGGSAVSATPAGLKEKEKLPDGDHKALPTAATAPQQKQQQKSQAATAAATARSELWRDRVTDLLAELDTAATRLSDQSAAAAAHAAASTELSMSILTFPALMHRHAASSPAAAATAASAMSSPRNPLVGVSFYKPDSLAVLVRHDTASAGASASASVASVDEKGVALPETAQTQTQSYLWLVDVALERLQLQPIHVQGLSSSASASSSSALTASLLAQCDECVRNRYASLTPATATTTDEKQQKSSGDEPKWVVHEVAPAGTTNAEYALSAQRELSFAFARRLGTSPKGFAAVQTAPRRVAVWLLDEHPDLADAAAAAAAPVVDDEQAAAAAEDEKMQPAE
jgi:hypothetical protein